MARTTIDGLAVRSSKKSTSVAKKSSTTKAGHKAKSRSTAKSPTHKHISSSLAATDPLLAKAEQKTAFEEFTAESVNHFDDELPAENEFTDSSTADWSEVLASMNDSNTNSIAAGNDFLDTETPKTSAAKHAKSELENDFPGESKPTAAESDDWDADALFDEFNRDDDQAAAKKIKPKKKRHIGRIVAISLLVLFLVGGVGLFLWGDGLVSRITGGKSGLVDMLTAFVSDAIPFDKDTNGRTNVLIFGTEGYNMDGEVGDGVHDGAQLTDSIMVVSFDQDSKDVAMLSLPRDLKVTMACSAGKINEVFWCHNSSGTNEEAGARALMQQVGEILGINIQYFAHVNWGALTSIVDTLGGITITLDEDINDFEWTGAIAQAGVPITVDGEQALGLARARHGTIGGDFTRGNTQQKILEGIVEKVVHDGIDIPKALGLLNILGDNLRSNFSSDNIRAGVRLVSEFDIKNMRQVPLANYEDNIFYVTTAEINEISYVVPTKGTNNYTEIQSYVGKKFSSDPIVREGATIAIYNATDTLGKAGAERDILEEAGFTIAEVGNTDMETCAQDYCLFMLNEDMTGTQMALEKKYGITAQAPDFLPEDLMGRYVDFILIIGQKPEEA